MIIPQPVLTSDEMAQLKRLDRASQLGGYYKPYVIRGLYQVTGGGNALETRLEEIFAEIDQAIADGSNFLVLSDRDSNHMMAPIPSLLLTSAVQHHLLRKHTRTQISMVVEAGDVREIHHVALLIAYGAAAVNPYLAFESVEELSRTGYVTVDPETAIENLRNALSTGVLKIMSKMGVSTIMSYRGAQLFEAVGLDSAVIDKYFTGTVSRVEGCGLDDLAEEVAIRHREAYPNQWTATPHRVLRTGGEYKWRRTGEEHLNDPEAIFLLQQSTQRGDYDMFKRYSAHINDTSNRLMTLRGLMKFNAVRKPIDISEVEPATEIVKRFSTGAMSYGSISKEAHETLAIAMNSIGARSNSGEGGESTERLNDPKLCSKIKQIASARFGVTSDYLVHATESNWRREPNPARAAICRGPKCRRGSPRCAMQHLVWSSSRRLRIMTSTPSRISSSSSTMRRWPIRRLACMSSLCPNSVWAPLRPVWPSAMPTWCSFPAMTAVLVRPRSMPSAMPARHGRSVCRKPSRR